MSLTLQVSLFLLTTYFGSEAFPLANRQVEITAPPLHPFILPTRRTVYNILTTCLSTILFCGHLSMIPNVRPMDNSPRAFRGGLNLVELFWVIVAPELILAWALRQCIAAARVRNLYNETRVKSQESPDKLWTLHHGFFVIMGGFTLIESSAAHSDPAQVLSFEHFSELVRDPRVNFPSITADEIKDRSKADELSQFIGVLQGLWFVLQCLIRYLQRVPIAQLELLTLTPVITTAFTAGLYWRKPVHVQVPVKIRLPPSITLSPEAPHTLFRTSLYDNFFGIIRSATVAPGALHVPRFYAPKTNRGTYGRMLAFVVFGAISGIMLYFGAKYTVFTSALEFKIWQYASLGAAFIPILLLPVDLLIERRDRNDMPRSFLLNMSFGGLFLLYLSMKVVLIGQAFSLLRDQPKAVYAVADWTKYLPHIS